MRQQTFYDWLTREVASSRMALVGMYANRDDLLYVQAPQLRKKYMDTIGVMEQPVLEAELELAMLKRKMELIQAAVNRREPIDMEKIEAILAKEKQERIAAVESADMTLHELPQLTEEQMHTLQRQYREITTNFHPAMNKDLTEVQRELYEKAVEAYKMQDVEAMKVIYDALFSPVDTSAGLVEARHERTAAERRSDYGEIASALTTDYLLAKKLYEQFVPLEEDSVVLDTIRSYDEQRKGVEAEIEKIRQSFPFNAVETMENKEKTEEYLAELRLRAKRYEREKAALEEKIAALTEEAEAHG